jgi:hypothetical protein
MIDPLALDIRGSTQPEVFSGTVDLIADLLRSDADAFWQEALQQSGPIEIWELGGERYLYDGNHRYHAAIRAGVGIPSEAIRITNKTGSTIPTFAFKDITWLPGLK